MVEEVQQVPGNFAGGLIGVAKGGVPVGRVGADDGHDFGWVHVQVGFADPFTRGSQRYGFPVRGQGSAVVARVLWTHR